MPSRSADLVERDLAQPVADVLATVAELRLASERLLELRGEGGGFKSPAARLDAEGRAAAWVKELTERVQSRARSAGIEENELLTAAGDVIDGRARLPEGVEPLGEIA